MKKRIFLLTTFGSLFVASSVLATSGILGDGSGGGDVGPIKGYVDNILGYIAWAAWLIVAFMIVWMGIKYMMAAANERADLKNAFIRYIIGAVIVAAASTIFSGIMQIAQGNVGAPSSGSQVETRITCTDVFCRSTNVSSVGTNPQNGRVMYRCNTCQRVFDY